MPYKQLHVLGTRVAHFGNKMSMEEILLLQSRGLEGILRIWDVAGLARQRGLQIIGYLGG